MSGDPAIEAAWRALVTNRGHGNSTACEIDSAREALKPIQQLHRAGLTGSPREMVCGECMTAWPCATARLVYPESELS